MNCTHPVIYTDVKGKYCHVCKARLNADAVPAAEANKNPAEAEKLQEAAKKPAKRAVKKDA